MFRTISACVFGLAMCASASASDLICYEYDQEGRLKKATRDDGSQLEYSFVDPSSEVDRNDNRQQLFQRTGQQSQANCATPTGAEGTQSSANNAFELASAPSETFFAQAPAQAAPKPDPVPVFAARNDSAAVRGAFQTVFIDVLANDGASGEGELLNLAMPDAGMGFVRRDANGVWFTSAASDGVARFAYQVRTPSGETETAQIKVVIQDTQIGSAQ